MPQTRSASFSAGKRKRTDDSRDDSAAAQLEAEIADAATTSISVPPASSTTARDQDDASSPAPITADTINADANATIPPSKKARKSSDGAVSTTSENLDAAEDSHSSDDHEESEYLPLPISKTEHMKPLPRAGMVDPVGYKTNPPPTGRPVRIYADGVFDLFHLGHMRQLEQCKTAFPDVYLIVGVTGDKETHRRKGLTVLSGAERAESVRHCKWVDEVVPDCPWIVTPEFLDKHEIDYVAHDDLPYGAAEGDDIYAPIKQQGKFLVTQRTEGVSTTGIITHIVRDYDKYIARQLSRGTTRQELNVSWLKKNELEIKRHVSELRDTIKNNWTNTQEFGKELRSLWNSRPNSPRLSTDMGRGLNKARDYFQHRLENGNGQSNGGATGNDFATGYSLGLMGGVRAWMTRNVSTSSFRNRNRTHNDEDEDSSDHSSVKDEEHSASNKA
ncbi:cholinephosphate cytidylyltransferase [Ascosphaera apis ARSEF 7405]|uniref:choline-phosphate cytidylyltransferase n=1 Tax=Ascosphaera apis ARSEF 7405 TaxID=392613 RepID=A0A168D0N6_9EURO|nr:cholinephosphate cytidylyltransferase [Ascosphaera apis ARSEF 7405]